MTSDNHRPGPSTTKPDDDDATKASRHRADDVEDAGPLESLGEAISAPVLDADDDEQPTPRSGPRSGA